MRHRALGLPAARTSLADGGRRVRAALAAVLATGLASGQALADNACCSASTPRPETGGVSVTMSAEDLAKLGKVHFPISCNEHAQTLFSQALAMLHSFWYDEASCTFTAVVDADPSCAMGHWGVAMSLYHPLWANPTPAELAKGAAAVRKARELAPKTARERDYVEAIATFYATPDSEHRVRAKAYEAALERLYRRYRDDNEAAAFYSLSLMANADPKDKTLAAQRRAGAIAEKIMAAQPDHPGAAHYVVHAYDFPALAARALPAARRYAQIAPSAPHALHMPSHTFSQLGLWEESISSNIASAAAAKSYAERAKMAGAWEEQLHAMDYLAFAHLQLGHDAEAAGVLAELRAIRKTVPERSRKSAYAFEAVPARYALERRRWKEAAALSPRGTDFPRAAALTHFARGYARARLGDAAGARQALDKLVEARDKLAIRSEEGATATALVDVQRLAVAAWIAHLERRDDEALRMMKDAAALEDGTDDGPVTPGPLVRARELLGELLLELGRPKEALVELEASNAAVPHRFNVTLAMARAKQALGDVAGGRALRRQLEAQCGPRGCDPLRFSETAFDNQPKH